MELREIVLRYQALLSEQIYPNSRHVPVIFKLWASASGVVVWVAVNYLYLIEYFNLPREIVLTKITGVEEALVATRSIFGRSWIVLTWMVCSWGLTLVFSKLSLCFRGGILIFLLFKFLRKMHLHDQRLKRVRNVTHILSIGKT